MFRQFVSLTLLATLTLSGIADAGVRGNVYVGDYDNAVSGSLHFAKTGDGFLTKSSAGESAGSYTELDLIVVSFWKATITQPTTSTMSGVSFLGLMTTARTATASGIFLHATVIEI